jgi:mannose-6-phosphate isomerase-like protein (cupin superfamily)
MSDHSIGYVSSAATLPKDSLPHVRETEESVSDVGVRLFVYEVGDLPKTPPFKCSRFTVGPGCETSLDHHDVSEFWFISSGSLSVFVDGVWHEGKQGDLLHFKSRQAHRVRNIGAMEAEIFSMWW